MTGYGGGQAASRDGSLVAVEISSVNRKQLDISASLPRELEPLEPKVRAETARRIARGRVAIRARLEASDEAIARQARVNRALAAAYAREFARLGKELKIEGSVALEQVLAAPGVLRAQPEAADPERFWPPLRQALTQALDALIRMREREGRKLAADLKRRVQALRRLKQKVAKRAPEVPLRYREQLLRRLEQFGLEGIGPEDERIAREIALFADRCDISEELTRLDSHFAQFDLAMTKEEPTGRALDFLAQEMLREINTIGSKANDAQIAHAVIAMKSELEKFREQVQNIE